MRVLSIAGSDPSSGAGIQGDIKTFYALGVYGTTVVTAITSQNVSRLTEVSPVNPSLIKNQIEVILEDFPISAIKIGMVYDKITIKAIHSELEKLSIPIILDPIFRSSSNGILQRKNALVHFKKYLIPLSHIITPNIEEAEKITDIKIKSMEDIRIAAKRIQRLGAKSVIIKGGHFTGDKVTDVLLYKNKFYTFSHPRINRENHGGGCTFSASLCAYISMGKNIPQAVDLARRFTVQSILHTIDIGRRIVITNPTKDIIAHQLSEAITEFSKIKNIHRYIPECQTNFVYARQEPNTLDDVFGIEGRIVKTGNTVTQVGYLKYGGSKHVASAVLTISEKFPKIRSAVNVKYDTTLLKNANRKKMDVVSYDRTKEPQEIRKTEGKSVSWGIQQAILRAKRCPDIIYHKGGMGKESMILIFGNNPRDVLKKIKDITI